MDRGNLSEVARGAGFHSLIYKQNTMLISKEVYPNDLIDVADVKYITLAAGKSGTSTMSRAVNSHLGPCIHTHGQFEFEKVHIQPGSGYTLTDMFGDMENYQGQVRIFSIYREPLARIISNCFQFRMLDDSYNLNRDFSELLPQFIRGDLQNLLWCPHEDADSFGKVDIYKHPFDHEKGYTVYHHECSVVYFFLFSMIGQWGEQLSGIFDKPVSLCSTNVTTHTGYKPFLQYLRIKRDDVRSVYEKSCRDLDYFLQIGTMDRYCDYISTLFRDRYGNVGLVV